MKRVLKFFGRSALCGAFIYLVYLASPRVRFYVHYEIWLPPFCDEFEFTQSPDFFTLFYGVDGQTARANFETEKEDIESLIQSVNPQSMWLRYSELDSTLKDKTFDYHGELPDDVLEGNETFAR